MTPSILLALGTGRCGTLSLARVLNQQPDTQVSFEAPPLLPWRPTDSAHVIRERFARFRRPHAGTRGTAQRLGDVAPFYMAGDRKGDRQKGAPCTLLF
jgi:hypothetical protein